MNIISTYVHIKNNQVSLNGKIIFSSSINLSPSEFFTETYKNLGLNYPKFHKMDSLSKLGFLCGEYISSDFSNNQFPEKTAIILSNKASSLDTDRIHQNSISDKLKYYPSPAIFVYTLPNIVIGEIAIRHKIIGENAFFVSEKIDAESLNNYSSILLDTNITETVICGWVNVDGNNYEGFIFLIRKQNNTNKNSIFKPLNHLNVIELYNQTTWMH
jgi:hypothetical protein